MNKYAFFLTILLTIILTPTKSLALIYDEAQIIKNSIFVTRLDFEKTHFFECKKTCKKINEIPEEKNKFTPISLKEFSLNLPPIVRTLRSDDQNFVATFRSDGKTRVIQVIDLLNRKSYEWKELIEAELLLEETRLLAWRNHELFFLSDISGYKTVYSADVDTFSKSGFTAKKIIGGNFEITDFLPLSGNRLAYVANPYNPYDWRLFIVKEGVVGEVDLNVSNVSRLEILNGDLIYSKMTNAGFEVYSYDDDKNKVTKIKLPEGKDFKTLSNVSHTVKKIENLSGTLVKPENKTGQKFSKSLIIWLHGGPHRQASHILNPIRSYGTYDSILSLISNETGAQVFKVDYPGSTGHGKDFATSIYKNVGRIDVEELAKTIETAKKELGVEKVYVAGTSYGGYLSLKFLAEKENLVDGVFAINAVTDWYFLFDYVRGSPLIKLFGDDKKTVPEHLWNQADIFKKIEKVSKDKPIVIAYGNRDNNVPYSQSKMMINFLRQKNKNVKEIIFQNEEHTIKKKSSIKTFCLELMKLIGETKPRCEF